MLARTGEFKIDISRKPERPRHQNRAHDKNYNNSGIFLDWCDRIKIENCTVRGPPPVGVASHKSLTRNRSSSLLAHFRTSFLFAGNRGRRNVSLHLVNSEVVAMYRICKSVRSTHGQDGAIVLDIKQG